MLAFWLLNQMGYYYSKEIVSRVSNGRPIEAQNAAHRVRSSKSLKYNNATTVPSRLRAGPKHCYHYHYH